MRIPPAPPPPREWGLVPMPPPDTTQFIPPPYALHMCVHLPAGLHYYRACGGADTWPRNTLSLVGAVHYVQVSPDQTRYSSAAQACRPPPSSSPNTTMSSSRPRSTAVSSSRPPALAVLVPWCWWPRTNPYTSGSGFGACLEPARTGCLQAAPTTYSLPTSRKCCPAPGPLSAPPCIVTLNMQMPLRPTLRALDVLIREYQYPLTLHVQESGPLVLQTVHPLYHAIQARAKVAGGFATLLFRAPNLYVTSYCAHPTGLALITHFTVVELTHRHANVYLPADGDLEVLQEILDRVYPHLLLTPAQVVVFTGDLDANFRWGPHLQVAPAPPL